MKKNILWLLLVLGGSLLVVGKTMTEDVAGVSKEAEHQDFAIISADSRDVLAGLKGVIVVVEDIKEGAQKYGLTKEQLRTDVELRLRQNGIPVLSVEECRPPSHPAMQYLYINVNTVMGDSMNFAAANVNIWLRETVILSGRPKPTLLVGATTWSRSHTLLVGNEKFDFIRDKVKDSVDEFCNDYLAANPNISGAKKNSKEK